MWVSPAYLLAFEYGAPGRFITKANAEAENVFTFSKTSSLSVSITSLGSSLLRQTDRMVVRERARSNRRRKIQIFGSTSERIRRFPMAPWTRARILENRS